MALTPDQFIANNDGNLINNGGTQCVAVFNQQERDVVEGGWIGTPLTGYAIDLWTEFGKDGDYANYVRVDAGQPAQKGDSAIWKKYNNNGLPHVAYVIEDRGNGGLYCLTQNPGNAHKEVLTKNGLAGYLRPKKFVVATPAPAPVGKPVANTNRIAAKGTATVLVATLNVRSSPDNDHIPVAQYGKGQTFTYDSYIIADGYVWLSYIGGSGQRRYVAEGPNDGNPNSNYVSGGAS